MNSVQMMIAKLLRIAADERQPSNVREAAKSNAAGWQLQLCSCGHYYCVHTDEGPCRAMAGTCDCPGFTAPPRLCRCGHPDTEHGGSEHVCNHDRDEIYACGCTGYRYAPRASPGVKGRR